MLGTFVLLLLLLGGLSALIWHKWPIAAGVVFGSLVIFGMLSSLNRQIAVARILGMMTPPKVAETGEYLGRYTEHWEIPHILVFTGYRLFGLLPQFERWLPEADSDLPASVEGRESQQHLVNFSGVVSERGRFGHMGMAERTVRVTKLIEASLWPDERSVFFSGGSTPKTTKAEQVVHGNTH